MSIYRDPRYTIEERVEDLLDQMTLEEKVGQMCQSNGREDPEHQLRERHVGSFLDLAGEETQQLQGVAAQSRLGIPILFGIDAIHGHAYWPPATVFPTQLGFSCSWNPELVEEIARITAREAACTGVRWNLSPVMDVARDLRWGRIGETFGEDPYLAGVLGRAMVRGYQGESLADPHTMLACPKHLAGYSGTRGGRDASEADLSERSLRSTFLPPFQEAVEAGCKTVMAAYHAIDGTPCTASRWLLWDVLREEWGFDGVVVTDWNNVGRMHTEQMVCATLEEGARCAIEAGNDVIMCTSRFVEIATELVKSGQLDEATIDGACRRILRLKFELGLFGQNRYTDLEKGREIVGCAEHRQVALESAYQSIVLLKNQDDLLPLDDSLERVAILGPNAHDIVAQLGDWVFPEYPPGDEQIEERRASVVTVLDGIRNRVGAACRVDYCRGCDAIRPGTEHIAEAAALARQAQIAIVVVGDTLALNGEERDRASLDLTGGQQQLLEAVYATGTPTVVVLINGKPLSIPWVAEHAHAILEAWNPGSEGGTAVAGILFGDRNPRGKLTISFPYHVGQQPVYYNQLPGWHGKPPKYVDAPKDPLFAFGYGLSYTTYEYSNLKLSTRELSAGEVLRVQVDVKNAGKRAGTEIVQLYVNDVYSSVTTPVKELQAFQRVTLEPGEKATVSLSVPYERLALIDRNLETVVEPGGFEVMVGSSSRDGDLLKGVFEVMAPMRKSGFVIQ